LTSLSGLDNIIAASISDLVIKANSSLSKCEVKSICDYLADPTGTIQISDNAYGCNNPQEVEDACDTITLVNINRTDKLILSPNPFTTSTTISYILNMPSFVTISIFNTQGKLIDMIEHKQPKGKYKVQWNAEGLPAGMYYCRIQAGDKVELAKMIKY
jgi:hypothetical protein